jgi:2-amino-4-hydroxy-6-hydroxymethyldihydropteridine diphosphokinase
MSNAVLSIGSNDGDRAAHLAVAVAQLRPWLTAVSPVYRTPPWGPVRQPDYLNAVLLVADPAAAPADWLARAQSAEQHAGRTREIRWGPRTLDVDVIAVDDTTSTDPTLLLPHPRAAERAFVLVPWLCVDSGARLGGARVVDLLEALPPEEILAVQMCGDVVL